MTMLLKYCMVSSLQAYYILGGDGRPHVLCVWNDQKKKKNWEVNSSLHGV